MLPLNTYVKAPTEGPSPTSTTPKAGTPGPLKILQLKQDTAEVEIMEDNLAIVDKLLDESGAEAVSIIAVMGSYRTGKSFLLDLLLRYLRMRVEKEGERYTGESEEYVDLGTTEDHVDSLFDGLRSAPTQGQRTGETLSNASTDAPDSEVCIDAAGPISHMPGLAEEESHLAELHAPINPEWKFGEDVPAVKPPWLLNGNKDRIAEGSSGECQHEGFHYRSGMDKCTEGVWLWSQPFVFRDRDDRSIAVLLMDTQGAWDDSMTKSQSSTIFGLTSLLASKLIYNIQNLIEEDKLDNLDYFTTFAQTVCSSDDMEGIDASFGHLQILIRDWANYEDGYTMGECKAQMMKHQGQHLSEESAVDEESKAKCARLHKVFRTIKTFGLCHPGLKVARPKYAGELAVVEDDFFTLLDEFVRGFFSEDFPQPSAPLGCEILVSNFSSYIMNIAKAFRDNEACSAVGLREAFVKVECMASKESMLVKFREGVEKIAPENSVIDPDILLRETIKLRNALRDDFASKLKPWKMKDEKELVDDLVESLNQIINVRRAANDHQVEGATLKLVASPVVGFSGYFLIQHTFVLYTCATIGAWLHVKKHTTAMQVDMCHPAVPKALFKDWCKFTVQRWKDLQAIAVALSRFNPTDAMESINRTTNQMVPWAGSAMAVASTTGSAPAGVLVTKAAGALATTK